MTPQEFTRLIALQDALWPHARRPDDYGPVYDLLAGIDYAEALEAVKAHAAAGEPYPPNAPGIIRRTAEAAAGADLDLEAAFRAARRLGAFAQPVPHPGAREELERRAGPALAEFVALHYREWAMAGGPDGDPVAVVRAQLQRAWEASRRRAAAAAAAGLAGLAPPPPAMIRAPDQEPPR